MLDFAINFADYATLFVCDLELSNALNKLGENSAIALTCLETNYFKITMDKMLIFDKHVNKVCSKANRNLNVFSRMRSFFSEEKRRRIF